MVKRYAPHEVAEDTRSKYVLASDYDALAEQLDIAKKARLKPDCALQDRITALLGDLARTQEVSRMANATAEKLAERVKGLETACRALFFADNYAEDCQECAVGKSKEWLELKAYVTAWKPEPTP